MNTDLSNSDRRQRGGIKKPKAEKYEGGNEIIDRLLAENWPDQDNIWMVNGAAGRRPIFAGSREEAIQQYEERRDQERNVLRNPQQGNCA